MEEVRDRDPNLRHMDDAVTMPARVDDAKATTNDPELSTPAMVPGMAGMATGMVDDFSMDYGQASYDVFDPLNWMLDGIVDFPYNFNHVQPNNISGIEALGNGL